MTETAACFVQRLTAKAATFGVPILDAALSDQKHLNCHSSPRDTSQNHRQIRTATATSVGIHVGQTALVIGAPHVGKSTWLYQLAANHIIQDGLVVWICCLSVFDSQRFETILKSVLPRDNTLQHRSELCKANIVVAHCNEAREVFAAINQLTSDYLDQITGDKNKKKPSTAVTAEGSGDASSAAAAAKKRPRGVSAVSNRADTAKRPLVVIDGWGICSFDYLEPILAEGPLPLNAAIQALHTRCTVSAAVGITTWPPTSNNSGSIGGQDLIPASVHCPSIAWIIRLVSHPSTCQQNHCPHLLAAENEEEAAAATTANDSLRTTKGPEEEDSNSVWRLQLRVQCHFHSTAKLSIFPVQFAASSHHQHHQRGRSTLLSNHCSSYEASGFSKFSSSAQAPLQVGTEYPVLSFRVDSDGAPVVIDSK